PPGAAATSGLTIGQQQRFASRPGRTDVIDRAGAELRLGPRALPGVADFEHGLGTAADQHRQSKHRRRAGTFAIAAQQTAGAGPVENHSQGCDIAPRAEPLLLHHDRRDEAFDLRIRDLWAAELFPGELLRLAPTLEAGVFGTLAGNVDFYAANFDILAARHGNDATVAAHLRHQRGPRRGQLQRRRDRYPRAACGRGSRDGKARHRGNRGPFAQTRVEIQARKDKALPLWLPTTATP